MFENYPKFIYAIYPNDEQGNCAGVYIGITCNLEERLKGHLSNYQGKPKAQLLHSLMRSNGYTYQILDIAKKLQETYKEYDWIDFFDKRTDFRLFNDRRGKNADWRRVKWSHTF